MSFCQWDCRFGTWAPTVLSSVPPSTFPAARPAVPSCHAILPVGISVETVSLEACPDPPPQSVLRSRSPAFLLLRDCHTISAHPPYHQHDQGSRASVSINDMCIHRAYNESWHEFGPNKSAVDNWPVTRYLPSLCFFFSDCIAGRFWTHSRASDSASGLHYSLVPWQRTPALTP